MVPIVQLVRASDCGSECRRFESDWAPKKGSRKASFFCVRLDENQVRHRRSRLSDSERIRLGTLKETDSVGLFFLYSFIGLSLFLDTVRKVAGIAEAWDDI